MQEANVLQYFCKYKYWHSLGESFKCLQFWELNNFVYPGKSECKVLLITLLIFLAAAVFNWEWLSQSQSSSPTLVVLLQWIGILFGSYLNVLQGRRVRIKHGGLLKQKLRFFGFFKKKKNNSNQSIGYIMSLIYYFSRQHLYWFSHKIFDSFCDWLWIIYTEGSLVLINVW